MARYNSTYVEEAGIRPAVGLTVPELAEFVRIVVAAELKSQPLEL